MPNTKEPLVVYIIGDNRSGSTLLDYLLSCHPDAASVGELHHLKDFYLKQGVGINYDWRCSCGSYVQDCNFWKNIIDDISFSEAMETNLKVTKGSKISFLNRGKYLSELEEILTDDKIKKEGEIMASNRWKLYKAIAKRSKKNIVIDSSKDAFEAYFINEYKEGHIKFLNIEREIPAVALSKKKRADELSDSEKEYLNASKRTLYTYILVSYKKLLQNQIIGSFIEKKDGELKSICYSNLTKRTDQTIAEICSFLKISSFEIPLKTNQNNEPQHTLCGSPSRYKESLIKYDDRWKSYYKRHPLALMLSRYLQKQYKV